MKTPTTIKTDVNVHSLYLNKQVSIYQESAKQIL